MFFRLKMSFIVGSKAESWPVSDRFSCLIGLAPPVVDLDGVESTKVLVKIIVLSLSSDLSDGPALAPCLPYQYKDKTTDQGLKTQRQSLAWRFEFAQE